MGYANKNWVQTQFENFSKRIAAVFARKSDIPTSLPASNTTSDYSAVGTDPVNGVAVSKALQTQQTAIDGAYQQATGYTDQAIANLINGAPSTLDTLGEIAAAMEENADVVDALEAAIGTKASQDELDGHTGNNTIHITASERQAWNGKQTMTGDTKDNTVTFTSGDNANPAGWENVGLITSGEKQSSLWNKMSLFAKNVRYLWKLLGNTSLSGIGDGTVTGAINTLNTSLGSVGSQVYVGINVQTIPAFSKNMEIGAITLPAGFWIIYVSIWYGTYARSLIINGYQILNDDHKPELIAFYNGSGARLPLILDSWTDKDIEIGPGDIIAFRIM